jgi:hypothetical protein
MHSPKSNKVNDDFIDNKSGVGTKKVKQPELNVEFRSHNASWYSIEDVMNLRIIAIEYQTTFC